MAWLDDNSAARHEQRSGNASRADAGAETASSRVDGLAPPEPGLVMIADLEVPAPDRDSGSARMRALIDLLLGMGQRVVFCPMRDTRPGHYTESLSRAGVTVLADEVERERFLAEAGGQIGHVLLSRPTVAWHMADRIRITAPRAVLAYDTVDLHFVRLAREAELVEQNGDSATARMLRKRAKLYRELELALVRSCDCTFVVSADERAMLAELAPEADVRVLSNVHVDNAGTREVPGRTGAVFVGSFAHAPNRDAAHWLSGEIWPLVRRRLPGAELDLIGDDPEGNIAQLSRDGITVRGWMPELDRRYETARMALAPLRFGSGIKGKVGESIVAGVPVVGTSVAFEGMRLQHGSEVLIGDSAEAIADWIFLLYEDDVLWKRLSESGGRAITSQFGPHVAKEALRAFLAYRPHG